jgi:Ca2+-transporting ATPase
MSSSAARAVLRPNPALGLVLGVTVVALALALEVPWLRGLFGFASLTSGQIGEAVAAAAASLVASDLIGMGLRRLWKPRGKLSVDRAMAAESTSR